MVLSHSKNCQTAHLRLLAILISYFSLMACGSGIIKSQDSCINKAEGLERDPYTGHELEPGQLSLIFTGGPSQFTAEISELLQANGIAATFFVEGRHVRAHHQTLQQLIAQGHLIGNSAYSGESLVHSRAAVVELRNTDLLLEPYIKGNMFLFHPPGGHYSERLRRLLNEAGLVKYVGPILPISGRGNHEFLSDTQCWQQGLDIASCVDNYLNEIRRVQRGIIAFSDLHPQSYDLISQLLPVLDNEGFSYLRSDEVPSIHFALRARGGKPQLADKSSVCKDYH